MIYGGSHRRFKDLLDKRSVLCFLFNLVKLFDVSWIFGGSFDELKNFLEFC